MTASTNPYLRGLLLSGAGILLISPDGLLLRLVSHLGVFEVLFFRALFSGLTLALILVLRYGDRLGAVLSGMGRHGLAAAALMTASNVAFVGAVTYTTVANTLLILMTTPLFSALLGRICLGERVGVRTIAAIAAASFGVVVIFAGSIGGGSTLGDAIALANAAALGLTLVVLRRTKTDDLIPALCLAALLSALLSAPAAVSHSANARDFGILALMGFLVVPVPMYLYYAGVRFVPAVEVALLTLVETVLGPLWAWMGAGEQPALQTVIGGGVVMGAVIGNAVLGVREHRQQPAAI